MNDAFLRYADIGRIFDYLSLGAIVLSPDRRIVSINRTAEVFTGKKGAEVAGKYCFDVFLGYLCGGVCRFLEDEDPCRETVATDVAARSPDNGTLRLVKIESPFFGKSGEPAGCIEIFQDRAAFGRLVERIQFDDLRLKITLDSLDIGVLTQDRTGRIVFFNTMAERMTGIPRSRVLGRGAADVFGPEAGARLAAMAGEAPAKTPAPLDLCLKDGRKVPVRAASMDLHNEGGRAIGRLVTLTDPPPGERGREENGETEPFFGMVGRSAAMRQVFDIAPVIAASDAPVHIVGPTGAGKNLLAEVLHKASDRSEGPFLKIRCAAHSDSLLASELFGHARGALNGADRDAPGGLAQAEGGVVFLDEVGELSPDMQGRLLRAIEDRRFYPLGSAAPRTLDVRIISSTSQDLDEKVRRQRFRKDLYYRLNVTRIDLPPLCERISDLPDLAESLLVRMGLSADNGPLITEESLAVLMNHDFPGNVRELENILEQAAIVSRGGTVERRHLPAFLSRRIVAPPVSGDPARRLGEPERALLIEMLDRHDWNREATARALNINRTTLWRKMKKHKIADTGRR